MLADIGIGMLLSVFVSRFFHIELSFQLAALGIFFSLLPDFDVLIALFTQRKEKKNKIGNHREIAHFPFVYIFLTILVFIFTGKIWGTLFGLCVLFHFFHDSIGIGWGVKWLWPFSDKAFRFFSTKSRELSWRIASWDKIELKEAEEKYGDPDWVRTYYFHPTLISVSESLVFILGLVFIWFFWYK